MTASDPNINPFATASKARNEIERINVRLIKANKELMNKAQAFQQARQSLGDTPAQISLAWHREEQRLSAKILPDFIGKIRKQHDILEVETKKLEQISLDGLETRSKRKHQNQLSRLNTSLSEAFQGLVDLTIIVNLSNAFKDGDPNKEVESAGETLLQISPIVETAFRKLCNIE